MAGRHFEWAAVTFPITSIQIMGFRSRLWDFGVVGLVDKKNVISTSLRSIQLNDDDDDDDDDDKYGLYISSSIYSFIT